MTIETVNTSLLQQFTTERVAANDRLDYWKKVALNTFGGTEIQTTGGEFDGRLSSWHIGDLLFTRAKASSSIIGRKFVGKSNRVTLNFQHLGKGRQYQGDRSCELNAGDFTLASCAEDFLNIFPTEHEVLSVEAPVELLEKHAPDYECAMSCAMTGDQPGARMLHDFLLSLWRQADHASSNGSSVWVQSIQSVYLDLLGLAISEKGGSRIKPRSGDSELLQRVKKLVEARIHDPELRTASMASELAVSARTIQLAFASIGTTPSAYVLSRRMQLAAEYLVTAPHRSVTDIAMELGFNESSYFTRCFRKHYAMTPVAYRLRC